MTNQEKINLIEDALEIEINTLKEDTLLNDLPEYNSMAKLSIIILCDDEFGKKLTGEQIRQFVTVGDIVSFLS
jgi:acyl carrier protein